jgi:hypothetical protein
MGIFAHPPEIVTRDPKEPKTPINWTRVFNSRLQGFLAFFNLTNRIAPRQTLYFSWYSQSQARKLGLARGHALHTQALCTVQSIITAVLPTCSCICVSLGKVPTLLIAV